MAEEADTTLTTRCLCGAARFSCIVANSKLPLEAGFCHCTSCRHANGTLAFEAARWPDKSLPDVSHLSKYAFSPKANIYFCSTCGTMMFWISAGDDDWCGFTLGALDVPVGVLEDAKGILKFDHHIFVGDTKDGGISEWLRSVKGHEMKRFKTHTEELPTDWVKQVTQSVATAEKLNAHCLCNGVQFTITRPRKSLENPEHIDPSAKERGTWWLDPRTGDRFMAGHCVCESCRLSAGNDIASWSFIPDENIVLPDGSNLALPSTFGTLKSYSSSPDVLRYFCGICGACVFYSVKKRIHLPNVAVGLLDAEEGSRADHWLWWRTEGLAHQKEGLARDVIAQDLIDGMRHWSQPKTV